MALSEENKKALDQFGEKVLNTRKWLDKATTGDVMFLPKPEYTPPQTTLLEPCEGIFQVVLKTGQVVVVPAVPISEDEGSIMFIRDDGQMVATFNREEVTAVIYPWYISKEEKARRDAAAEEFQRFIARESYRHQSASDAHAQNADQHATIKPGSNPFQCHVSKDGTVTDPSGQVIAKRRPDGVFERVSDEPADQPVSGMGANISNIHISNQTGEPLDVRMEEISGSAHLTIYKKNPDAQPFVAFDQPATIVKPGESGVCCGQKFVNMGTHDIRVLDGGKRLENMPEAENPDQPAKEEWKGKSNPVADLKLATEQAINDTGYSTPEYYLCADGTVVDRTGKLVASRRPDGMYERVDADQPAIVTPRSEHALTCHSCGNKPAMPSEHGGLALCQYCKTAVEGKL